eukprot:scaffold1521_cov271-Chaetoceros_neogracile.AAC.74
MVIPNHYWGRNCGCNYWPIYASIAMGGSNPTTICLVVIAGDILVENESKFKMRFAELVTFKEKYGNCNVSKITGEDRVLGNWLSNMRATYKKKKAGDDDTSGRILTDDQIVKLEELGVKWSLVGTFEERFEELRAFKDEHGRCPTKGSDGVVHKQLYEWLCITRHAYKNIEAGKSSNTILLDEQRKLFATIGLVASLSFEEKLEELRAFKDKHNERCPTAKDKDYKKLYNWMSR